ncbi:MAG: hypothetical protein EAZ89_08735 [Bacteroidetes bacterium]|nr:MAG: hypothetical protein EAZ89_08735 [Bacteroidota bacterium]
MRSYALISLILIGFCSQAFAQFPPRREDYFWSRKVVNRIDLNEKINSPLRQRESVYYSDNSAYSEKEGMIMCLFNGLKAGKFPAYNPDSLNKQMTYDDVLKRIREIEGSLTGESEDFDDPAAGDGASGFDAFEGGSGGSEWGFEDPAAGGGDFADDLSSDSTGGAAGSGSGYSGDFDPTPFENVIQFVEDRIFDKTRSDMVYDVQFIEMIWTDPGETLPEKKLCTFRYKEVMDLLDQTQWKNRFNDAEYKTLRELFELRLFHSYIIEVSGDGLSTLQESEDRRQKLVEFEHHLWSY